MNEQIIKYIQGQLETLKQFSETYQSTMESWKDGYKPSKEEYMSHMTGAQAIHTLTVRVITAYKLYKLTGTEGLTEDEEKDLGGLVPNDKLDVLVKEGKFKITNPAILAAITQNEGK